MDEAIVFRRNPITGRWAVSDLSQAAGAPLALDAITYTEPGTGTAIVAGLTSFTTLDGVVSIAGIDAGGHIRVVWTSPVMEGRWTSSDLSAITGAAPLLGGLAPYLPPWGGINLAGLDEESRVVIDWWTPESNIGAAAVLDVAGADPAQRPLRRLDADAAPDGAVSLLSTGPGGQILRLHWQPGQEWALENLTQAAAD